MPAIISDQLQRVLNTRDPSRIGVVIESDPGRGDAVADLLGGLGIDTTRVGAGDKSVFEATVTQEEISEIQQSDAVAIIDFSPTFLPTGVAAPVPGRTEAVDRNVSRPDLQSVIERLRFPQAWDEIGSRGEGVRIGMVDTPIADEHPALESSVVETAGGGTPSIHGTWVASAMVADKTDVRRGTIQGGAPDAELYAYGALGDGGASVGEIVEGIGYLLDNDCDIINLSLGGSHSAVLASIIETASTQGAVVVSSAGNAGPGRNTVSCPAHHDETVAVGSISTAGEVAAFSSRGPGWVDAYQKPDVMAYGGGALLDNGNVQVTEAILGAGAGGEGAYLLGTSMSAPQVAAMAALRATRQKGEQ